MTPNITLVAAVAAAIPLTALAAAPANAGTYTIQILGGSNAVPLRIFDDGNVLGYSIYPVEDDQGNVLQRTYLTAWVNTSRAGIHTNPTFAQRICHTDRLANTMSHSNRNLNNIRAGGARPGKSKGWGGAYRIEVISTSETNGIEWLPLPNNETSQLSNAVDIAPNGDIAGWSVFQNDDPATDALETTTVGMLWRPDNTYDIMPPLKGHTSSRLDGINEHGIVVGTSIETNAGIDAEAATWWDYSVAPFPHTANTTAAIWHAGKPIDLNTLVTNLDNDTAIIAAFDIDNHGRIAVLIKDKGFHAIEPAILHPNHRDFNGDGEINDRDHTDFLAAHSEQLASRTLGSADIDRSGVIDVADIAAFLTGNFRQTPSPESTAFSTSARENHAASRRFDDLLSNNAEWPYTRKQWFAHFGHTVELAQLREDETPASPFSDREDWLQNARWDQYDPVFNPNCYGCHGGNDTDPGRLDGYPGWPGEDPNSPYHPHGGPGGNGVDSRDGQRAGNGGRGGDGAKSVNGQPAGNGGRGGDGGDGRNNHISGHGGAGGHAGHGRDSIQPGAPGQGGTAGKPLRSARVGNDGRPGLPAEQGD